MNKKIEYINKLKKSPILEPVYSAKDFQTYLMPSKDPNVWEQNKKTIGAISLNQVLEYLRKSRNDMIQNEEESEEKTLARHRKELDELCLKYFGETIPENNIFKEVKSGENIKDRVEVGKLLKRIEDPEIKAVVVIDIERLARGDTLEQGMIIQAFQYSNTKILTVNKLYNLNLDSDRREFEESLRRARDYIEYTKGILGRGRRRSTLDGKYPSSQRPYGYDRVKLKKEKGYTLKQNILEKNNILFMIDKFLNGIKEIHTVKENETISEIAKYYAMSLEQLLIPNIDKIQCTRKGGIPQIRSTLKDPDCIPELVKKIRRSRIHQFYFSPGEKIDIIIRLPGCNVLANYLNIRRIKPQRNDKWTTASVYNVLTSWSIAGYITWDYRKGNVKIENGEKVKSRPLNNNPVIAKGLHEPIIDLKTFKLIQKTLSDRDNGSAGHSHTVTNPLMGIVTCSVCGRAMQRRPPSKKTDNNRMIRKHTFTEKEKEDIKQLLREHVGNFSYNELATLTGTSKDIIGRIFTPKGKSIPSHELWPKLKKVLNIENNIWDKKMTELVKAPPYKKYVTLICPTKGCKNVAHIFDEVENAVIEAIKLYYEDSLQYLTDYKNAHNQYIIDYSSQIKELEKKINELKLQKNKICELREMGDYDSETFSQRNNVINKQIEDFVKQISYAEEEMKNDNYKDIVTMIPKMREFFERYNENLTPLEKNQLLKTVINEVIYTKLVKGTVCEKSKFEISLKPLLPKVD